MQRLKILRDKLKFICWFFDLTTAPFIEIKRKIETSEDPYESDNLPADDSEPPFVMDWLNADQAIKLQGQLCLSLLQRTLREYLDDTVKLCLGRAPAKGDKWFEKYKKLFLDEGVDWGASTASISLIEELTFARNRIHHGSPGDSHSLIKELDQNYKSRFPKARFQNDFEARIFAGFGPALHSIELTKEELQSAVEQLLALATFNEERLPDSTKCWKC